jgi:hypothetical protein
LENRSSCNQGEKRKRNEIECKVLNESLKGRSRRFPFQESQTSEIFLMYFYQVEREEESKILCIFLAYFYQEKERGFFWWDKFLISRILSRNFKFEVATLY